jgi:endonuclease YncB( thermonuclease family)
MKHKLIFILCILLTNNVFAENLTGKVVSIADGDTVTILTDNKQTKIRLAEIDTPEKNQPYGKKAKKALSDFIFGKTVRVEIDTIDRYGRTVGTIFLNDLNINKEMVKAGHAWVYVRYAKDKTLFDLEKNAKENQLGLWALPEGERIAPWQWRRGKRNMEKESNLSFQCESKTTCRQMQSCAEAKYYLMNCGLTRLDGDKDGVPCESICR